MNTECLNPDVSLSELYRKRNELKRKLSAMTAAARKEGWSHENMQALVPVNDELRAVNAQITKVEHVGFNGGGIIRIM